MITASDLHDAADEIEMLQEHPVEPAISTFLEDAMFHPPMSPTAVAYGILIGLTAAKHEREREEEEL